VDREGVPLLTARVGGTPVISMNGNRWVGPGHNAILTDFAGQDWFLYHAVDSGDPYFDEVEGALPIKRPLLMDPLDWIDGWATVRGGLWASDAPQPAPAARPGDKSHYSPEPQKDDEPGNLLPLLSHEFDGDGLGDAWTWVREPDAATFGVSGGG